MTRLSDLPLEVSAEPIFQRLNELKAKSAEGQEIKSKLEAERGRLVSQAIDEDGLKERLKRAIGRLDTLPAEEWRPIYANVLKFAELHPTKIRLGLYALAASGQPTRVGSTTVQFGARGGTRTPTPYGTGS